MSIRIRTSRDVRLVLLGVFLGGLASMLGVGVGWVLTH
jgi:hypothetical protein